MNATMYTMYHILPSKLPNLQFCPLASVNCTMWKELQYQNQFPKFYIACDKLVSLNECVRVLTAPDSKGGWLDIKAGD